jgi:hypothetical protein
METKILGSMRLTQHAWRLLRLLAARAGVSMTAVVELLIREQARKEGIE